MKSQQKKLAVAAALCILALSTVWFKWRQGHEMTHSTNGNYTVTVHRFPYRSSLLDMLSLKNLINSREPGYYRYEITVYSYWPASGYVALSSFYSHEQDIDQWHIATVRWYDPRAFTVNFDRKGVENVRCRFNDDRNAYWSYRAPIRTTNSDLTTN
jgi:hypothetical protein